METGFLLADRSRRCEIALLLMVMYMAGDGAIVDIVARGEGPGFRGDDTWCLR
jgi:hypothetical protein